MIKTIIFDIGNVLMKFDSLPYMRRMLGNNEEDIRAVRDAVFASGRWDQLDLGRDPEEVFLEMIALAPDYEEKIRLVLNNIDQGIAGADYAKSWIKDLKERGYQVLFLSNYSEYVMESRPDVLDFLPLMDGGIFSCYVGMKKPDPAIFKKICETYHLNPSECVFIDDTMENIKAASAFGLNTLHFKGYEESRRALDEMLQ